MVTRAAFFCGLVVSLFACPIMAADKVDLKGMILLGFRDPFKDLMLPDYSTQFGDQKLDIFKHDSILGKDFNSQLGFQLNLTQHDGYTKEETIDTLTGTTKYYFNQTFKGVPIWGQRIIASGKGPGDVVVRSGYHFTGIEKDLDSVAPRLPPTEALAKAKSAVAGSKVSELTFENERADLVIYVRPSDGHPKLSYNVSFFTVLNKDGSGATRPEFIVDADTGEILLRYEGLAKAEGYGQGGNARTKKYYYGPKGQFPPLDVEVTGADCTMKSSTVVTIDMKNRSDGSGPPFTFPCFTNDYKEVNGAYSPINDAHYFANVVFRMFRDWYNLDLLNELRRKGKPPLKPLEMRVHWGEAIERAYWQGSAVLLGDGGTRYYPWVSLNTVGHEIGHGYTEFTSVLQPNGQHGAIREAFSDLVGEAAESYSKGGAEPDFLFAPSIVKGPGAVRYMCEPTLDGSSIDHASKWSDQIEQHRAAGVFNKAFCLLAKTPDWNVRKTLHLFLVAQKSGWDYFSTFAQAAEVAVDVAEKDLGFNAADVHKAFAAVGVL